LRLSLYASLLFLACSLPYVVSVLLTGNPFEARL
jgi:hypothetical protein